MTDYQHVGGFKIQAMILNELLAAVQNGTEVMNPQVQLNTD